MVVVPFREEAVRSTLRPIAVSEDVIKENPEVVLL